MGRSIAHTPIDSHDARKNRGGAGKRLAFDGADAVYSLAWWKGVLLRVQAP